MKNVSMPYLKYLPRFQRARAALADLAVQETLRRPDITTLQLAKLNALWQNAQAHVPAYTPLFTKHAIARPVRVPRALPAGCPRAPEDPGGNQPRKIPLEGSRARKMALHCRIFRPSITHLPSGPGTRPEPSCPVPIPPHVGHRCLRSQGLPVGTRRLLCTRHLRKNRPLERTPRGSPQKPHQTLFLLPGRTTAHRIPRAHPVLQAKGTLRRDRQVLLHQSI